MAGRTGRRRARRAADTLAVLVFLIVALLAILVIFMWVLPYLQDQWKTAESSITSCGCIGNRTNIIVRGVADTVFKKQPNPFSSAEVELCNCRNEKMELGRRLTVDAVVNFPCSISKGKNGHQEINGLAIPKSLWGITLDRAQGVSFEFNDMEVYVDWPYNTYFMLKDRPAFDVIVQRIPDFRVPHFDFDFGSTDRGLAYFKLKIDGQDETNDTTILTSVSEDNSVCFGEAPP